ncbi:MAG: PIN domain-containing protein [Akkermansiaceae bacterium]|nr:PIN domain-containing protein [Akkermansiaceae bacterium]MCF7732985.1 PIN domain-containing protein [Akkermansiaceae bacterium]
MILFDVNVLIYAHREDQVDHEYFRRKLEVVVHRATSFGMSPLVATGFVRIVTHPKFPNGPTPLPQALAVVESLMQQPNAHWIAPGKRHWELLADLCRRTHTTGKSVADAQHAAVAIEHACTWVSRNRDFSRFVAEGLRFERWSPSAGNAG